MTAQSSRALPRVALVGRPNVGKSTLFNRLVGRREAIVHDRPGVTRDRIARVCRLQLRDVMLEDTGGLVPASEIELVRTVTEQTIGALEAADLIVLVVDGRIGVTPLDAEIAELLHGKGTPVVLAVNKLDSVALEAHAHELWHLGLDQPFAISAEHGLGVDELVDEIEARLPPSEIGLTTIDEVTRDDPDRELRLAIVGRPNVGKSSIVNRLVGAPRVTVNKEPGTTRDAIDVVITREGRAIRLIDTAGIRRRAKVASRDEEIGIMISRRRIKRCHVAILVADASAGLTSQDVAVAGEVVEAGRPMIVAFNKWDLIEDPEPATTRIRDEIDRRLAFARYARRLNVSALTGQRVFKLIDAAHEVAHAAMQKVTTSELNRFLERTMTRQALDWGTTPSAAYMTQVGVLPPRFLLFCRGARRAPDSFRRFLENRLREEFSFGPTPVVVELRDESR